MSIVRYNILTKTIECRAKDIRFSCFLPSHLQTILKDMKDDDYILGVQYMEKNDIQVGITGTGNENENWKRTLTRELCEELKLYPNFNKIESSKVYNEHKRNWLCCKLHIEHAEKSTKQELNTRSYKRDWRKKIGIFVYGAYEQLIDLLSNNYTDYVENDNISHIVIINVGFIKQHLHMFAQWFKPKSIKYKDYFDV